MSDDHLFQTHLKDIPSPAFRPTYTFSSKNNKEPLIDFKEQRSTNDCDFNVIKEQHRRTLTGHAKIGTHSKDLQTEIVQHEAKFQLKDREINLKSQPEVRGAASRKLQERDENLSRSRSPLTESTAEARSMKSVGDYDSKLERLVAQNKGLKREIEKLTEKLRKYEEGKGKESYYKVSQDLPIRLKTMEGMNENLQKENDELREETSQLRKENFNIKKSYEDLKSRYESLETTATSNKADYSTESGANSEVGSKCSGPFKKFSMNDIRSELEGMKLTWQEKSSSADLGLEEYKKIVEEIMEMYRVKNPMEIVPSIQKTEKVVQMVPKLRKLISDVAAIVFPRVGHSKDKGIELILPSLKKLCKEFDEADVLSTLRSKLIDVLQLEKDCSNVDIVKRVDKLATLCYQSSETKSQQGGEFRDQPENNLLVTQFAKIFGMQPNVAVFRQISKQLDDFKQFINVIKHKLKLEPEMKNEACLIHLLKFVDGGLKEKQITEIIHRLQSVYNCGLDTLGYTLERMALENKKEKTYSHNGY